jgi:hypothetical protein
MILIHLILQLAQILQHLDLVLELLSSRRSAVTLIQCWRSLLGLAGVWSGLVCSAASAEFILLARWRS